MNVRLCGPAGTLVGISRIPRRIPMKSNTMEELSRVLKNSFLR
jgi:hypothetical protein